MMGKRTIFGGFIEKLRDNKRLEMMVYAALIAAAAVIFIAGGGISCVGDRGETPAREPEPQTGAAESELEARLESILSSIEGTGEVRVMITYENKGELIPAEESQDSEQNGSTSLVRRPVTVSSGGAQSPVVLEELSPSIRGAIVVAQGASDPRVRDRLRTAAMTVLGTSPESISVFPMK